MSMKPEYDPCVVYPRDLRHAVLGSMLIGVFSGASDLAIGEGFTQNFWRFTLLAFIVSLCIWLSNLFISVYLNRRYPDPSTVRKRLVYQLLLNSVLAFVITFAMLIAGSKWIGIELNDNGTNAMFFISILITLLINLAYIGAYFFEMWKEGLLKQEQLQSLHTRSQLEALRAQVDPHFLFNAMTTLSELIYDDQQRASEYVERLSQVYRYILDHSKESMVSLQEELKFLKAYTFLLQTRYGDSLHIEWPEESLQESARVPALATQIVLENVIKHNIIDDRHPMLVQVLIEDGQLLIRNRLHQRPVLSDRNGTGHNNLRSRYWLLTGQIPRFTAKTEFYLAQLPIQMQQS